MASISAATPDPVVDQVVDPVVDQIVGEVESPVQAPVAPVQAPVDTPVETPERVDTDGGDHDRFAHYCRKDDIVRATITGEAIVALCGKKWVPTRDPERYPICPACKERKAAGWRL